MTELEGEFSNIDGQKAIPIRYIRSQQMKQAKLAAEVVDDEGEYTFFYEDIYVNLIIFRRRKRRRD